MSKKSCLYIIICVAFVTSPLVFGEDIVISFRNDVSLEGNDILLGDIADISGDNSSFINALERMYIGEIPGTESGKRNFTQAEIMLRMRELGLDTDTVIFKGSDISVVHPSLQTITGDDAMKTVEAFIRRYMPWDENDVIINPVRKPDDVEVVKGKVSYDVIPISKRQYIGKVRYCLVINVDGKIQKNVDVFFDITIFKKVLVATRQIRREEMLTPRNVRLVRREIESNSQDALSEPSKVIGMIAARNIQAQGIIKASYIQMPYLIRRREMVRVVLNTGGLTIQTTGIAAEDGCLGEYIKIKNPDSKKVFFAKVLGIREVGVSINGEVR